MAIKASRRKLEPEERAEKIQYKFMQLLSERGRREDTGEMAKLLEAWGD